MEENNAPVDDSGDGGDATDANVTAAAPHTDDTPHPVSVTFTVSRRWLQSTAATVYRGECLDDVVQHIHHWLMEISKDEREYERIKKVLLDKDVYQDSNYELLLEFETTCSCDSDD